jgi:hypothetical protein
LRRNRRIPQRTQKNAQNPDVHSRCHGRDQQGRTPIHENTAGLLRRSILPRRFVFLTFMDAERVLKDLQLVINELVVDQAKCPEEGLTESSILCPCCAEQILKTQCADE